MRNAEISNTTSQVVATNGTINLGNISRNLYFLGDCNVASFVNGSNNVKLNKGGYYEVKVSVVLSSPSTGNATIYLASDGVVIPRAYGTETISAANTEIRTITFSCLVRNIYTTTLSLVNTGIAATISKVSVILKKLC